MLAKIIVHFILILVLLLAAFCFYSGHFMSKEIGKAAIYGFGGFCIGAVYMIVTTK